MPPTGRPGEGPLGEHTWVRLSERGLCPRGPWGRFGRGSPPPRHRGVARTARAPDSKSGGWGFESLHPCHGCRAARERDEVNRGMEFATRVREFVQEVLLEFRRVTWPSRQELVNSTVVVLVLTVIVAFFLGGVDIGLSKLVQRILR